MMFMRCFYVFLAQWAEGSRGAIVITYRPSSSSFVCPSVHNFFEQHLLNHSANFNQISKEWSLGGSESKLFKDLESI